MASPGGWPWRCAPPQVHPPTDRPSVPLSVLDLAPVPDGLHRRPGARQFRRARPSRRAARLHPPLGGRTPQHGRHRQLVTAGVDRPPRERHHDAAGRRRRRDAPQSRRPHGRRAVRHVGGVPSRPDRPRSRTCAGHRRRHRRCAPPQHARGRRRVPDAARRPARLLRRHPPADHRRDRRRLPAGDLAARFQRLQRPRRRTARPPVLLRPPLRVGRDGPGARRVPRVVPAVAVAGAAVLDDRRAGDLRRRLRRGDVPVGPERAVVPQPPPGQARSDDRHPRKRPCTSSRRWSARSCELARPAGARRSDRGGARSCRTWSTATGWTS